MGLDNMNIQTITALLHEISYKPNWHIAFYATPESMYIQLEVSNSIDSVSRETVDWKSGKRYLSQYMCRQEIIGVVYSLIEAAEIHEMREWFRYKGASIYNPHLDPDVLVEVARKASSFNCRDNAMDMTE
jgi:hypothetical protein